MVTKDQCIRYQSITDLLQVLKKLVAIGKKTNKLCIRDKAFEFKGDNNGHGSVVGDSLLMPSLKEVRSIRENLFNQYDIAHVKSVMKLWFRSNILCLSPDPT